MNKIFTIGHSNRAFSEFVQKLKENKIEAIIDVRTFPRSRFCPQFNQKRLAEELLKHKVQYIFKGKNLGGRGENTDYEETLDELSTMVKGGQKICVMCSEGDHKKCHRYDILEPDFLDREIISHHIEW